MSATVVRESSDGGSGMLRRNGEVITSRAKEVYDQSIKPRVAEPLERRYSEFKREYPSAGEKLSVAEQRIVDVVDRAVKEGKELVDRIDTVIDAKVSAVQQGYQTRVKPHMESVRTGVKDTWEAEEVKNVRSTGEQFASSLVALIDAAAQSTLRTADQVVETRLYPLDDAEKEAALKVAEEDTTTVRADKVAQKWYLATVGRLIARSGIDPKRTVIEGTITNKAMALIYWNIAVAGGSLRVAVDNAPKYRGPASTYVHKAALLIQRALFSNGTVAVDSVGILPATPAGSSNSLNTMANGYS